MQLGRSILHFFGIQLLIASFNIAKSQETYYQDICHCGVTGAGFSTGFGSGSGTFDVFIEPGSEIKKAYLFTYSMVAPDSVAFELNSNEFNFNDSEYLSSFLNLSPFANPIKIFA